MKSLSKVLTAGALTGAAASYILKKSQQVKAVNPIVKLDDNIYLMDFNSDYKLNKLLSTGVSNIGDLLGFVCLNAGVKEGSIRVGTQEGSGCTTFQVITPNKETIMGRNFDFKTAPCFLVWTHPENAYASLSVVDNNFLAYGGSLHTYKDSNALQTLVAPYCCVDGINEKGLSIAVLQIRAKATWQKDPNKKDMVTTAMIRAVLDTCKDVDEAVQLISSYNMHDSLYTNYHYQMIDANGRSVVVEYIDNQMYVYEKKGENYTEKGSVYEDDDSHPYLYLSNYSATKDIGSFQAEQHGHDRINAVKQAIADGNGIMSEMQAMDLLKYVKLDYDHPKYPWRVGSLWSAVYNADAKTVTLAAGMDYSKVYTFAVNEPLKVIKQEAIVDSVYPVVDWEYL